MNQTLFPFVYRRPYQPLLRVNLIRAVTCKYLWYSKEFSVSMNWNPKYFFHFWFWNCSLWTEHTAWVLTQMPRSSPISSLTITKYQALNTHLHKTHNHVCIMSTHRPSKYLFLESRPPWLVTLKLNPLLVHLPLTWNFLFRYDFITT